MNYNHYRIGNAEQLYRFLFVTGACRSGKTTFSRILGSMQNTEWIEEPYELILFSEYIQLEKADAAAQSWREQVFTALCKELANDAVLLRNGNFRPGDLSTIWNFKEGKEIFHRLVNVNTRTEVEAYVKANDSRFVIDVPEVLSTTGFMKAAYRNLSVVHFVRNPYDVAEAIFQKGWYSDQAIRRPEMNAVYRVHMNKDNEFFIPWWIEEGCEQDFIDASEYERGIMYWIAHTENKGDKDADYVIKYEDMVHNPQQVLEDFYQQGFQPTARTKMLCDELCTDYISGAKKDLELSEYFAQKFVKLKETYHYG